MHTVYMARDPRFAATDYVRFVMSKLAMTPHALAKVAGLAPTTLTRPLNSTDHKFTLTTTTLDKIRHATGYDYAPFLSQDMDTIARTLDQLPTLGYQAEVEAVGRLKVDQIPVIGEVAAGVWREVQFQTDEPFFALPFIPSEEAWIGNILGLVVRGESLNKIARDGDILLAEAVQRTGTKARDKDLVVVERRRDQDGIIEVTAKRLRGRQLMPESTDQRYQTPLVLGEHENEIVQIIGIVHYILRKP